MSAARTEAVPSVMTNAAQTQSSVFIAFLADMIQGPGFRCQGSVTVRLELWTGIGSQAAGAKALSFSLPLRHPSTTLRAG